MQSNRVGTDGWVCALCFAATALSASAAPPTPAPAQHATQLPGVSIGWVQPAAPTKSLQEWKNRPPVVVQESDLISPKGSPKPFQNHGGRGAPIFTEFTAAEVRKMAVQAGRYRCTQPVTTGTGAARCAAAYEEVQVRVPDYAHVTLGTHTAMPQAQQKSRAEVLTRWVPLPRYVDEINAVEKFLRRFGRSLREKGDEDMGVIARLREPSEYPHQPPPAPVPGFDTHIVGVPAQLSQDFLQPVKDVDALAVQLQLAAARKDTRPRGHLLARLAAVKPDGMTALQLRKLVAAGVSPKELIQAGVPSGRAVLFDQPMSFDCPAGTDPKPPGQTSTQKALPPQIPAFLNSKDWYTHVANYFIAKNTAIAATMAQEASGEKFLADCVNELNPQICASIEKTAVDNAIAEAKAAELRLIDIATDKDISAGTNIVYPGILPVRCDSPTSTCTTMLDAIPPVNPNEPIPPRGHFDTYVWDQQSMCLVDFGKQSTTLPACFSTVSFFADLQRKLENNAGGSGFASTSAPTDAPDATQKKISCLYDGTLNHPDYPQIGGSSMGGDVGLFGAHLQIGADASSETCFGGSKQDFYDWVGANFDLTVFGADLSVLDFSDDACGPTGCSGAAGAKYTFLGEDFSGKLSFDNTVDGPGGIVMIGPVPLHIGTRFHYSFGVTPAASGIAWSAPSTPHVLGSACPAAGSVLAQLPIRAEADAGFEAALDLLIVSAGVDAQIQFIDAHFSADMETDVNPPANEVAFRPGLDLNTKMLGGWLDAFVEVDLLLYSKRWTLEIFRYDGFTASEKPTIDIPPEFAK